MNVDLDHLKMYRLPWSLPDNAISWLEPTVACNIQCPGCYRKSDPKGHKSLEQIKHDLAIFKQYRKTDGVSIAGGEPLLHPEILEIVHFIAEDGLKPIINTNGILLTKELLKDLKKTGVAGFTFHIDSKQGRPDWKGKNEVELNELRLQYAEMLAEVGGGLSCAFNATVFGDTLKYVPEVVTWGQQHIDIVHVLVFIAFRMAVVGDQFDYYAWDQKLNLDSIVYSSPEKDERIDILSNDIVEEIRNHYPDFKPCAYLNGTEKPDSLKWLFTGRMGNNKKILGYVGPKFMELTETVHHLFTGRYIAYTKSKTQRKGKLMTLLLWPFDSGLRRVLKNYLTQVVKNPLNLFRRIYLQSITIIQPADILPDGRINMCDSCPDITVYQDQLMWSCRLEERKLCGTFVRAVPKEFSIIISEF